MKKENRELMEQMLMAIHAKDTLEMLEKAAGYYQKKS